VTALPTRLRGLAQNLALSLIVTTLFLGALEGIARLVERRRPPVQAEDYIWDWQKRWDGDFYTMRSDSIGWPPWEEFNADGLRDRTHAVEKPEGVSRVVFLGDSVTLGDGLTPQEAYPQVMQASFDAEGRPIEVFNVALWGWSTRQERIAYQRLARRYRPDLVVLAICLNDIPELQNNLTRPPRWITALHERSALVRLLLNAQGREIRSVEELFESPEAPKVTSGWQRFFAEVRGMRDEVTKDGAAFALIVFPFRFQVAPGAPPPLVQEKVAAFCDAQGLRCLDLLPVLRPAGEAAFVDYDHLSVLGARQVAAAIEKEGLLPEAPSAAEALRGHFGGSGRHSSARDWLARRHRPASPQAVRSLLETLRSRDPRIRRAATWALGRAAPSDAAAVVASLSGLLADDPSEAVRAEAAAALGVLGVGARRAVPALLRALGEPRQAVRWSAARTLAQVRPPAAESLPALVAALESDDGYVRGFATWMLGELGAEASAAVPALIEALAQEEGYSRAGAATALGRMGAAARDAVPALVRGLQDPDGERRWKAARALGKIGPEAAAAVPALAVALSDAHEFVRAQAAKALGRIGPAARRAVPVLRRSLSDPVEAVRAEVEEALGRLEGG
jgi:HEAT repeat protein/lysophospholipase L1-like esterase